MNNTNEVEQETMTEYTERVIPDVVINELNANKKYIAARTKRRGRALDRHLMYVTQYPSDKSQLNYLIEFEKVVMKEFINLLKSKTFKKHCLAVGMLVVKVPDGTIMDQINDLDERWEIMPVNYDYTGMPNIAEIYYEDFLDYAERILKEFTEDKKDVLKNIGRL